MPAAAQKTDWIADVVAQLSPLTSAAEASNALRTSPRNLRRMIADGRLRAVRSYESGSSRVLVPRLEIERYLRSLGVVRLDRRDAATLHAETLCDPRTIRAAYEGRRTNIAAHARLREAAERLGLPAPPPRVRKGVRS